MFRKRALRRLRLLVCALTVAAPLGFAVPAAHADCVSAEVQIWTAGDSNPYRPLGEKYCVVPTPFNEGGYDHAYHHENNMEPGYPSGVDIWIWYVLPPN
jgi:hypothetical protein